MICKISSLYLERKVREIYKGEKPEEVEMKRINNQWSDIGKIQTTPYMVAEIEKNFPWISNEIKGCGKNARNGINALHTLGIKKMTLAQMVECVQPFGHGNGRCYLHSLYFADKDGNMLCEVCGSHPSLKPSHETFWSSVRAVLGIPSGRTEFEPTIVKCESVGDSVATLGANEKKRVVYAVEKSEEWYDFYDGCASSEGTYLESFSFYIYKTPVGYKNFSEFVEKTLNDEQAATKKEFAANLAEIDK